MNAASIPSRLSLVADLSLLGVAAIWGSTFVMVKDAVAQYPVLPFLALRFALAALALVPAAWLGRRAFRASDLPAGMAAGAFLFAGYALQTFGLQQTEASKAGFITGLSVVLVPLFVAVLWRKLPSTQALAGTVLATAGLGLLSLNADWSVGRGDLLVLGCAVGFAAHITALGVLSPGRDPRILTLVQVATVAALSGALVVRQGALPAMPTPVLGAAVFTGLAATALAFLVQTTAQRFTTASHTALIFTAEPVFAAIFGVLVAGEQLPLRGWLGCAAILGGVVLGTLSQPAGCDRETRGSGGCEPSPPLRVEEGSLFTENAKRVLLSRRSPRSR